MDLLAGVQVSQVAFKVHGVKGREGAEVTGQPADAGVSLAPVSKEGALVGGAEVAVGAVVGHVALVVALHMGVAAEQGVAGVVSTRDRRQLVHDGGVSDQFPA